MKSDYSNAWEAMNDLDQLVSETQTVNLIIENAIDKISKGQNENGLILLNAAQTYLNHYIEKFDYKFKLAWDATILKMHKTENKKEIPNKWILPVESDIITGELFLSFPQDIIDHMELRDGDSVQWIDNHDGSFTLKKAIKN